MYDNIIERRKGLSPAIDTNIAGNQLVQKIVLIREKFAEESVTELGRRFGILAGAITFVLCLATGIMTNSDLLMSTIYAIVGGIVFGGGGFLIGNLIEGYLAKAFRREMAKKLIEKEMMEANRLAAAESIEEMEGEAEELDAAPVGLSS